jgi:uncharacterized protein YxjI
MSWTDANQLLVKEHLGLFKAASNYDIYDLASGEKLLECREPHLGFITKMARFHEDYRRMTPFDIRVTDMSGQDVVRVSRGLTLFVSKVAVHDGDGALLGGFKQKIFSIGGAFSVHDANDQEVCHLKGKWTGWEFQFLSQGVQLARVTKKWQGMGKEMFTTADNYVLDISEAVAPNSPTRKLMLAAVMCIDMVLKE